MGHICTCDECHAEPYADRCRHEERAITADEARTIIDLVDVAFGEGAADPDAVTLGRKVAAQFGLDFPAWIR